jgi:hypothetical protein
MIVLCHISKNEHQHLEKQCHDRKHTKSIKSRKIQMQY